MNIAKFLVNTIAASDLLNMKQRFAIYQAFGLRSNFAYFYSRCFFTQPDKLFLVEIGQRCFFNHYCFIENGTTITISNDVCFGPGVKLLTTTHVIGSSNRRVGHDCVRSRIVIEDGCWIGAGATILPGVRIDKGCVVGAGAMVVKNCDVNGLYAGVPARRVKDLERSDAIASP